jgi:3-oxoacyl-[acyl-carrier-protein] synthase-1
LQSGQSGLRPHDLERGGANGSALRCHVGEVAGLGSPLPPPFRHYDCRNQRLAWLALQQDDFFAAAMQLRASYGAERVGVFVGTSTSGIEAAERAYGEMRAGAASVLPDWFDYRHTHSPHSPAEFVADALGLSGPVMAICTACSSSAKVFAAAWRHIQMGWCDAAIVGGVDSLCLTTLHGFNSLQLLSHDVCRPADARRNGISIGEAAGFAVLEKPTSATPARARPNALFGFGESSDAHHMSAPDPEGRGAAVAMHRALQRAALPATAVSYINLHGTGTQANDAAEDLAVCAAIGTQTPCSSTKGWTGHTLGAAGIVEACLSLLCIEHGFMPQSLHTEQRDPALRANILLQPLSAPVRRVLSNSFGFGGSNCSLLLGRAE